MFDKRLENNRLQDEMTVVEKKNDENLKTIRTQKEECIDLSVKERETFEKIVYLRRQGEQIEVLIKDLSADMYCKYLENNNLKGEETMLKEKNNDFVEIVQCEKERYEAGLSRRSFSIYYGYTVVTNTTSTS